MKIIAIFLLSVIIHLGLIAQVPQALNYQAIARNSDGSIVPGKAVRVRFSILDGSATGTLVYQETHQTSTNNAGLFTLAIGTGAVAGSGSFSVINWATGSKFLKVEIELGGTGFQLQGTTQLLSVPYALYAEKSGTAGSQGPAGQQGPPGATGPQGPAGPQGVAGTAGATGLTGLQGPVGVPGPPGPQGASGLNGKTILNGTANPPGASGFDGDFYLNTTTYQLFGPKTNGVWGTGVGIIGPAGGASGLISLIDLENFPANVTCPSGGVNVMSGIDLNSNNVLEATEVTVTKQICLTQVSPLDKMIVIPLVLTAVTTPVNGNVFRIRIIINFDKNNYPGVDSIVLVANPWKVTGSTNTAYVKLFNFTDNLAINNSTITSTFSESLSYTSPQAGAGVPFQTTGNILNDLPNYPITLGISVESSTNNSAFSGKCYLYLYRK